jgi:sugar-specific transcriptional regulator TrmB
MNKKLIEDLTEFGLSEYEAKAYIALVSAGTGSVTEVSQLCDVPRPNLYAVLEKLVHKGFAESQRGRPVLFKAIAPNRILEDIEKSMVEKLRSAREEIIKSIKEIKELKTEDVEPALIWGVRGFDAVMKKIKEIIARSKKEIIINIPDLSMLDSVYSELEKAKSRRVKVKIATQEQKNIKRFKHVAMIRVRDKIHGTDIVADDREVLVAPSFPIVAAWVDNPEMALHVKDFLQLVWKDAQVLEA